MVLSTQPQPKPPAELLAFLQQKLGLSDNALELGLRQAELEQAPLPIVLWSFGLLNLLQYQEVLEWQRRLGQL
ncbi:hypothetical protein SynRS9909_01256 [Synechococcus sp. RS9909]|uniref:DUF2949 domain-containing protein n=1 Tax=unclassified Synechococcus TaxID=2626047 RepID=UPI0000690CE2|nr:MULTISPECIES: DUF2949 domain-containing protein [unclassified Synechococcus]EAQ67931.1 hypothetical protein RS9917_13663 [Synechococcus sp. RS9917]QNI79244.1 hypothetical protein SynRS9909_01256 [Synechococcus sp. RS9909]